MPFTNDILCLVIGLLLGAHLRQWPTEDQDKAVNLPEAGLTIKHDNGNNLTVDIDICDQVFDEDEFNGGPETRSTTAKPLIDKPRSKRITSPFNKGDWHQKPEIECDICNKKLQAAKTDSLKDSGNNVKLEQLRRNKIYKNQIATKSASKRGVKTDRMTTKSDFTTTIDPTKDTKSDEQTNISHKDDSFDGYYVLHKCEEGKCRIDKVLLIASQYLNEEVLSNAKWAHMLRVEKNDKPECNCPGRSFNGESRKAILSQLSFTLIDLVQELSEKYPDIMQYSGMLGISLAIPSIINGLKMMFSRKDSDLRSKSDGDNNMVSVSTIQSCISELIEMFQQFVIEKENTQASIQELVNKLTGSVEDMKIAISQLEKEVFIESSDGTSGQLNSSLTDSKVGTINKDIISNNMNDFPVANCVKDARNLFTSREDVLCYFLQETLQYFDAFLDSDNKGADNGVLLDGLKLSLNIFRNHCRMMMLQLSASEVLKNRPTVQNCSYALNGCGYINSAVPDLILPTNPVKIWYGGKWYNHGESQFDELYATPSDLQLYKYHDLYKADKNSSCEINNTSTTNSGHYVI